MLGNSTLCDSALRGNKTAGTGRILLFCSIFHAYSAWNWIVLQACLCLSGRGLRKTSHIFFPSPCAVCALATISLRSCGISAVETSSGWECWCGMFCPPCERKRGEAASVPTCARVDSCLSGGYRAHSPYRLWVWLHEKQWNRVKFVISWLKGALYVMRCGLQKVMVRKMQRFWQKDKTFL